MSEFVFVSHLTVFIINSAMKQLELGRIGVAAQAIGIGRGAFELAIKYARKRTVLGEKLADKQLVKAKLAEMATELEAARLLCEFCVCWNVYSSKIN